MCHQMPNWSLHYDHITYTQCHAYRSRAKAAIGFSYSDVLEEDPGSGFLEPEEEEEKAFSSESEYGQCLKSS